MSKHQTDRPLIIYSNEGLDQFFFDVELGKREADILSTFSMMAYTPVAAVIGSKTIRIDDFGCVDVIEGGQAYPASAVLQGKTSLQVTKF